MGDNPTVVELERENARLQAKLAAAESALAESKAECLDIYGKLATSSGVAARYIVAKVELERKLAVAEREQDELRHKVVSLYQDIKERARKSAGLQDDLSAMTAERDAALARVRMDGNTERSHERSHRAILRESGIVDDGEAAGTERGK